MNKFTTLLLSLLFLSGCNPNIQLDPSQWVCSKVEERYQSKLLPAGKVVIPTKEKVKMCIEWRMM